MKKWNRLPKIRNWRYPDSKDNFGIQAADVVCGLFQGAIRHELGDNSKSSSLKSELLKEYTTFELPEELKHRLALEPLPDGQKGLVCTAPESIVAFELTL